MRKVWVFAGMFKSGTDANAYLRRRARNRSSRSIVPTILPVGWRVARR